MTTLAASSEALDKAWLARLDPRPKLWYTVLAVALCLVTPNVAVLAGLLLATHIVLVAGGVPGRDVLKAWRGLAPIALFILILQPLISPSSGPALLTLGPLHVTSGGLTLALRYTLRLMAAAFATLVPVLTSPIPQLVRAFEKTGLPHAWALMIGLALRYLGTLSGLYTSIAEAQQARGWDLSEGRLIKRAKRLIPTLIALIVASLRLSDSLALGLAARGYGVRAGRARTCLNDIALRPLDWMVMAVTTAGFAAVFALIFLV